MKMNEVIVEVVIFSVIDHGIEGQWSLGVISLKSTKDTCLNRYIILFFNKQTKSTLTISHCSVNQLLIHGLVSLIKDQKRPRRLLGASRFFNSSRFLENYIMAIASLDHLSVL